MRLKPSPELMIGGHTYVRADTLPKTLTVYLVCQWHNCEDENDHCYEGHMVVELCATQQLADQLLSKRGGHSYGYVTKKKIITKLKEASY